jgi:carboxyvinyl-carboxyphosphonate phosphorylmutase
MHWTDRRRRFRAILEGKRCVHPASVFDPISARIAEDLGFELGMLAGSVASLAVLGAPDIILLTLSEFAAQAYRIGRAGNLPLLVDADHGYGNALNVMRTVDELETAGVAALTIEDTELPAAFGADKPRLVSIEEGVGKMRAAIVARQDRELAVVGRTSAASLTGIDDAVARARAYAASGVDALFFVGIKKRGELDAIAAAVKVPIILGGAGAELEDAEYLASRGVRIALQGHLPIMAAVQAVYEAMKALRSGARPASIPGIAAPELMQQVTRDRTYKSWADAFLKPAGGQG